MKILNKLKLLHNKRFLIIIIPVIFITLFILSLQVKSSTTNIATYRARNDEFIIDIRERGELQAASEVRVAVPDRVWGDVRITKLAEDGSMVEKDGFLVQFDTSEADNRVTDRKNDLDNANADLASTQARIESNMKQLESAYKTQEYSYEQSKLRYEMMKFEAEAKKREQELNFKKDELALKQAKEKIESQKIIDKADLAKAEVQVKQAEMRYNQAVEQLNALTLKSPKSGLVVLQEIYNWSTRTSDKVKVGDQPHRGMPLVSIPDLSIMLAKTQVNEVDISRIQKGQEVIITLDALPGPTFYGVVTNVATLAHRDEGTDVKVFDIEVTIEGNDERLKPGMTAQCTIVTGRLPKQLFVPLDCVFEKEDTTVVYVKDGGFKERIVKVGKKNSDYIIIEDGLEENEEVALRDPTIPLEELGTSESVATTEVGGQNNNR
ncbi:MAG: efflux RND transporter periplasmic adaptor subunit [Candidatus Latescibacteria bacterium]|nr:efflux RND transporter periplasmic adaptor subunit [Candidatus Latescibacterota bacterium]